MRIMLSKGICTVFIFISMKHLSVCFKFFANKIVNTFHYCKLLISIVIRSTNFDFTNVFLVYQLSRVLLFVKF